MISIVNTRAAYLMALESRDVMQAEIVRVLEDENSVQKTRSLDATFNECFLNSSASSKCPGQTVLGISLYNSAGTRIAGPPNSPAYFNLSGSPCKQTQTIRCGIAVTSTVRAQSTPQWYNNQLVEYNGRPHELVEVRYVVQIMDTGVLPAKQRALTGSYVFDTQDLMTKMME
ncbi:MAG: hypothetical protein EOP06_31260 [Proteobacteria bacterium]|nr:MAG: hypothetical protein EOP06_31260 [Pseudomonadota bacterium]